MRLISFFLPTYLDQQSKDPDEIDRIQRIKVLIVNFMLFCFISGCIAISNLMSASEFTKQAIMQIVMCFSLLGVLFCNKHFNILKQLAPVLYLLLYSFFFYKLQHYQTIRCSISFWFIIVPCVIAYIWGNRYATLSVITGAIISVHTFFIYDYPFLGTMDPRESNTLIAYLMAGVVAPIIMTSFMGYMLNLLKQWRQQVSNNIKREAQQRHLTSLGEISASIAHEINNPLAIIQMSNKVMNQSSIDEEKRQEYSDKIEVTIGRISSILKSLTKLSSNHYSELNKETVSNLMDSVLPVLSEKLKTKSINLVHDCRSNVEINHHSFGQILFNLIKNSIDAIDGKKENSYINVDIFEKDSFLVFNVEDSGPGIKNIDKVFEPFYSTKSNEGCGLGLAVVFNIIDSYNGEISARNHDEGAFFEVKIPLENL